MTDRLREAIKNDLDHVNITIPDRLIGIQNKVSRLTRDLDTSGKIYSHQVMDLISDVVGLLKDSAASAELNHLVQTMERIDALEVPGD